MKVRELQEQLRSLDPELEIVCYCDDEKFLMPGRGFILFDVMAVNSVEAEQLRLQDGTLSLKFGQGPTARAIVTLEVTSIF